METTAEVFSLIFTVFEESRSTLIFRYLLTDSPTKPSETGENSELPDASKAVKKTKKLMWFQSVCHIQEFVFRI
jgi:hypothetical protein